MSDGHVDVLVVVGSPEPSSTALVRRLADGAQLVVACDRGADVLHAAGVVPDAFYGDADTVSAEALAWLEEAGVSLVRFNPLKDDTDLDLALDDVRQRMPGARVTLTCACGGRPDHQLVVVGSLLRHADLRPVVIEDDLECHVLSPGGAPTWELEGSACGRSFSAVCFDRDTVISERGMQWEVDYLRLEPLSGHGLSNVVTTDDARVTCHEGVLAAFLRA